MFNVTVLISGRGSNLKALFAASQVNGSNFQINLVLSDQAAATGLEFATEKGIATEIVKRRPKEISVAEFNTALADVVEKYSPDLIVLAGFMRVLTKEFVSRFPTRIINIHPSLLPDFKGLDAQRQAFEAGVKFSGCTVHMVVEELDSGPILAQVKVPVLEGDDAHKLADRILVEEHMLLPKVVKAFAIGEIKVSLGKGRKIIIENRSTEL